MKEKYIGNAEPKKPKSRFLQQSGIYLVSNVFPQHSQYLSSAMLSSSLLIPIAVAFPWILALLYISLLFKISFNQWINKHNGLSLFDFKVNFTWSLRGLFVVIQVLFAVDSFYLFVLKSNLLILALLEDIDFFFILLIDIKTKGTLRKNYTKESRNNCYSYTDAQRLPLQLFLVQ